MPDDLLRFVVGPTPISGWWLALPVAVAVLLLGWYVAVFAMTATPDHPGALQRARDALGRRRALRAVRGIRADLKAGTVEPPVAAAALNRTLREFLQRATGARIEYMPVATMAGGELAVPAALFSRLDDARFNTESAEDVAAAAAQAEELIASWT